MNTVIWYSVGIYSLVVILFGGLVYWSVEKFRALLKFYNSQYSLPMNREEKDLFIDKFTKRTNVFIIQMVVVVLISYIMVTNLKVPVFSNHTPLNNVSTNTKVSGVENGTVVLPPLIKSDESTMKEKLAAAIHKNEAENAAAISNTVNQIQLGE